MLRVAGRTGLVVDLCHLVEEALVECLGALAAAQGRQQGLLGGVLELERPRGVHGQCGQQ